MEAAGVHKSPVNAGMIGKNWSICAVKHRHSGIRIPLIPSLASPSYAELPKCLLGQGLVFSGVLFRTRQTPISKASLCIFILIR